MKQNKKSLEFLEKYLNTPSPTGYEHAGQKVWMDYIKPYVDKIEVDNYGTCYGVINPKADFKVVIEAHADEISWYVNYITDDGLIYVIRNGGSDQVIAPSKVVHIHGEKGIVKGVLGGLLSTPERIRMSQHQNWIIFLLIVELLPKQKWRNLGFPWAV